MRRLRCVKHYGRVRRLNGLNDPMTRHDISSKLRSGLKCLPDLISRHAERTGGIACNQASFGHFQWVRWTSCVPWVHRA
jgi:hypothetical protein